MSMDNSCFFLFSFWLNKLNICRDLEHEIIVTNLFLLRRQLILWSGSPAITFVHTFFWLSHLMSFCIVYMLPSFIVPIIKYRITKQNLLELADVPGHQQLYQSGNPAQKIEVQGTNGTFFSLIVWYVFNKKLTVSICFRWKVEYLLFFCWKKNTNQMNKSYPFINTSASVTWLVHPSPGDDCLCFVYMNKCVGKCKKGI